MSEEELPAALEAWAPLIASGYEAPAASKAMHDAAGRIRALIAERDDARAAEIEALTSIVALKAEQHAAQVEVARLRGLVRVNFLRLGMTHAEIDAAIDAALATEDTP